MEKSNALEPISMSNANTSIDPWDSATPKAKLMSQVQRNHL